MFCSILIEGRNVVANYTDFKFSSFVLVIMLSIMFIKSVSVLIGLINYVLGDGILKL